MKPIKHILVATDFGESSDNAVEFAAYLANAFGATLTLLHAFEIPALGLDGAVPFPVHLITPIHDEAKRSLATRLAELQKVVPRVRSILASGSPCEAILEAAEQEDTDLIVMGTHGRRGLSRALLGSVAERTVRLSRVPVLTASDTRDQARAEAPTRPEGRLPQHA
jgi:nucleotide-binding universal stress UspA family protein